MDWSVLAFDSTKITATRAYLDLSPQGVHLFEML